MSATVTWAPWSGQQFLQGLRYKAAHKLNEAGADGVLYVQQRWPRDTGFSANTMEVIDTATREKLAVSWGNITADYVIWVEIGARGRPGRHIIQQSLEFIAGTMAQRLKGITA